MNPLDRIQSYYDEFTKTEQEIAIYIINHPLETARKPILYIAQDTHSSKSALIRFSQKIGYSGFSEFRFDLSRSLVSSTGQEDISSSTPIISAISNAYSECIQQIKGGLLQEDLQEISKMISKAQRIKILGYDRTYIAALQLRLRLSKIGYDGEAVQDLSLMQDFPDILTKKDLIILFTIHDNRKSYSNIIKEAHASNIPVICITMTPNLKFKKECDMYVCLPNVSKNSQYSFLDNQAIFLIFIEMLLETLAKESQQIK